MRDGRFSVIEIWNAVKSTVLKNFCVSTNAVFSELLGD